MIFRGMIFFSRVKMLLRSDPTCRFCFISPLYYAGLDELCVRAKTCPSAKSFYQNALSNPQLRNSFSACERYFDLKHDKDDQLNELVNLLSRCEFIVRPNNSETIQDLEQIISIYFLGMPETTRILLENFVNDTTSYGIELTASEVVNHLIKKGISSRARIGDTRIVPIIAQMNKRFVDSYTPIQGQLFHRASTERLIYEIALGKSVILHGKAGIGKSGCVHELIRYLESNHIAYLAIQLDKYIPKDFADKYGESLGLPGSPVNSLVAVSGTKPCVLILDQLDALRWTTLHTSVALDVCKEMIEQARSINKNNAGHINIVFSVRTFDYENDTSIRGLFKEYEQEQRDAVWSEIKVESFTDYEVKQCVGNEYAQLTRRVKDLLRVPSSLSVWLLLSPKSRLSPITSQRDIVRLWWDQIQKDFFQAGQSRDTLIGCVEELVAEISNLSSFALPRVMFYRYTSEMNYLASCGMLRLESETVSFSHQSFLDFFLLANDLQRIFKGERDFLSLVLSWEVQMPLYRYRLSALFQNVVESNQKLFVDQAKKFLESNQIHYYYKAAIFEAIGQLTTPKDLIYKLIDEYFDNVEWHSFILQTVYERHPVFIERLAARPGFNWLSEEGYPLLASMRYYYPSLFVSILNHLMESGVATLEQIITLLGPEIDAESEELFALRMKIYHTNISLLTGIDYINLEHAQPNHIIQVLAIFLSNTTSFGTQHIYFDNQKHQSFCEENYISILESLFSLLCNSAKNTPLSLHPKLDYQERYWFPRQFESSVVREIVELVKTSLKILAKTNPNEAMCFVVDAGKFKNGISNELALSTLLELPISCSDTALEWLLDDFDYRILDCISNEYDYLSTCKAVLKKFSASCSSELFAQLEERICTWKGDRERFIVSYKSRIEYNRLKGQAPVFWPAWGHLQKGLLPYLDSARTTRRTKELLAVLNRNEWVDSTHYHAGVLSGSARAVVSSIHKNAARLSDNTWLKIINSPVEDYHSKMSEKDDKKYFYESTHWTFAQDLGSCVKNNPERYAKLLLRCPLNCFPGYYSSVLYSLNNSMTGKIDFDLLCNVIRHCVSVSSDSIPKGIFQLISERHEENWPEDILSYLAHTAIGQLKPVGNERVFSSHDVDSFLSPEDMMTEVINSPRGAAVDTIGQLLITHSEMYEMFAPFMETLAQDESDVIRFALVKCIAVCYEINPSFSKQLFDIIIEKDPLAMCAMHSFWLMTRDLQVLEEHYFPYLRLASDSPNPKLAIRAAQMVCRAAILTSSEQVIDYLYYHPWSKESLDKIFLEATYAFEKEEYHTIGREILEHFLHAKTTSLQSINRLFYDHLLDLRRDERFISLILKQQSDMDTISAFINFINTQDGDISGFAETIKKAVQSVDKGMKNWQKYRIEDGLVHVVIRLIESARGKDELTECCLDILDEIFRKRILTDSAVFKLLDGAD